MQALNESLESTLLLIWKHKGHSAAVVLHFCFGGTLAQSTSCIEFGLKKAFLPFHFSLPRLPLLPAMPDNQHRKAFCSLPCPFAASHHNEGMDEEDWYSYKCCPGFNWQKQKVLTNALMPLSRLVSHSGPIEKCEQNITMRRNWSRQVSKVLPLSIMAMSIPD